MATKPVITAASARINMDIKQHRSCNGCRAMFRGWCGHPDVCYLGYDLTYLVGAFGISSGYPAEPCPKPRTYMDMCDAPRKII